MQKSLRILGVAGTNGSGKDSLCVLLAEKHGYLFISLTDMLRHELRRQNKSTTRENMRELSAKWRRESGLGVLVDKAFLEFEKNQDEYKGLVVASLRNPGEADTIHELGGTVVWVDADQRVRFNRLKARGREDDPNTFEQFVQDEKAEQQHSGDEATLSTLAVKDKANVFIENNGDSVESLEQEIQRKLVNLQKL